VKKVDPDLHSFIHTKSSGVPFFVAEIARMMLETNKLIVDGIILKFRNEKGADAEFVPDSISEIIVTRIDLLPLHLSSFLR